MSKPESGSERLAACTLDSYAKKGVSVKYFSDMPESFNP